MIKPTNLVNNLAPEILRRRSRSRALILYDGVEAFLISVLKRPRQSREGIEQFLSRLLADRPQARPAAAAAGDLPRKAALAWALQMQQLEEWLAGPDGARIRTLAAGDLLDAPVQSLCAVAEWLGIDLSPSEAGAIGAGPVWRRDAKATDRDYTPERRRQEQALARRVLAQPIAEARGWLDGTAALATGGFPQRLSVLA